MVPGRAHLLAGRGPRRQSGRGRRLHSTHHVHAARARALATNANHPAKHYENIAPPALRTTSDSDVSGAAGDRRKCYERVIIGICLRKFSVF